MSNTPNAPKKRLGRKKIEELPSAPETVIPMQPPVFAQAYQHRTYVFFYYETDAGDTGFNNTIVNLSGIHTVQELEAVIGAIKQQHPDYKDIQISNHFPVYA
ncbi:hypothetical protein CC53_gp177 [Rhizobium phage vB_RleS_L338C]|uniref:hypothetical protein n=1 Tax=Rhizobium phage vB_RleS_L338C TaxID=1414737 RepID=UPI0003D824DC|nr:hypothetical protein CC53_gp177 [Rhizobium phage vB_RleS_L338C]AHC30594.1 hypothetical protein L338C_177 [Rhizobium phage vB_RleS_L338C]QNH72144.1 hypothetical protein P11VFA_141 [Rhizobium phage P11VFA]